MIVCLKSYIYIYIYIYSLHSYLSQPSHLAFLFLFVFSFIISERNMKGLILWYFVLFFLFLSLYFQVNCALSSFSFNSSTPTKLCPHDQSFALIQLNKSLSIDCSASEFSCLKYKRKTTSWKVGTNCCLWDGVKCDAETGNVIGLDQIGRASCRERV